MQGVVTLDGEPLASAALVFEPTDSSTGTEVLGTATTDADGRFTVVTRNEPGALVGRHAVGISEASVPDTVFGDRQLEKEYFAGLKNRPIPKSFAVPSRSGVTVTVTRQRKEYTIELTREPTKPLVPPPPATHK